MKFLVSIPNKRERIILATCIPDALRVAVPNWARISCIHNQTPQYCIFEFDVPLPNNRILTRRATVERVE
jgi:hypothetical protein